MEQNNKPHTCEEYVLDQLNSAYKDIRQLQAQNRVLEARNKELEEKLGHIVTLIDAVKTNVELYSGGFMKRVNIHLFYENDNNYNAAIELFDIKEEHTDD